MVPKRRYLNTGPSTKPELSHNILIDKSSTYNDKTRNYELKAVVVHIGSEAGGHYYAYVKYGTKWFKCNDGAIDLVDEAEVNTKNLGFQYLIYQASE